MHEKGEHSKGSLIHDNTSGVLLYGNVYISNRERNALFKGGARGAMVNNLIFNPGRFAVHYNLWPKEWEGKAWQTGRLSLVGNQLRHGPSTEADTAFFTQRAAGHLELYMADNVATDRSGRPVLGGARLRRPPSHAGHAGAARSSRRPAHPAGGEACMEELERRRRRAAVGPRCAGPQGDR